MKLISKIKNIMAVMMITVMTLGMSFSSLAGEWQWIDTDGDTIAECYYVDDDGTILTDTVTPDGYTVNELGQWTEGGAVMQTFTEKNIYNSGYADVYPDLFPETVDTSSADTNRVESVGFSYIAGSIRDPYRAVGGYVPAKPAVISDISSLDGTYYQLRNVQYSPTGSIISDITTTEIKAKNALTVKLLDENTLETINTRGETSFYYRDAEGRYVSHDSGYDLTSTITFNGDGTYIMDTYKSDSQVHGVITYSKNVSPDTGSSQSVATAPVKLMN